MQQSSGPSYLTSTLGSHQTDEQEDDQQPGNFSSSHGFKSRVKLVLPVLSCGLLILAVLITVRVVDSSAKCKSGTCHQDWEQHEKQCYFFSKEELNWTQSKDECVRRNSNLAIINYEKDQKFLMQNIVQKMQEAEDKFWIGLNDRQTEGEWRWVDNAPLDESKKFWLDKEPDNWMGHNNEYPDGEDCVRMGERSFDGRRSAAGWVDSACERQFKFICETKVCQ